VAPSLFLCAPLRSGHKWTHAFSYLVGLLYQWNIVGSRFMARYSAVIAQQGNLPHF